MLVAPQEGDVGNLTGAFLRVVNPSIVLASSGNRLSNKQRMFDQIMNGRRFIRTANVGAITIEITPQGAVSVKAFDGREY